ncbi:hypothetical protein HWV07_07760 [Natronomonas salina]|uniref:hypothetical protein n=1 Tax=Natronomonas salina TaxID=1710540 RepID=UPI0015B6BEF3|nr:hypothetical protein [Natronomonas salina]QLD91203.1 hypothetical protein HWV07_07760 [Natronomonas salina]
MGGKRTEACGRCSVSTVVDAAGGEEEDDDGDARNPFEGARIEIQEAELRRVVGHEVLVRRVKDRLDDLASRFIYG